MLLLRTNLRQFCRDFSRNISRRTNVSSYIVTSIDLVDDDIVAGMLAVDVDE